jgi:hypothetical protein
LAAGEDGAAARRSGPLSAFLSTSMSRFQTPSVGSYACTIPDLIRVAAPVYVKFGLRGASDI